jgi:hypothetical protein
MRTAPLRRCRENVSDEGAGTGMDLSSVGVERACGCSFPAVRTSGRPFSDLARRMTPFGRTGTECVSARIRALIGLISLQTGGGRSFQARLAVRT